MAAAAPDVAGLRPATPPIRRATFTSVPDLIGAIRAFLDGYNQRSQPFRWTFGSGSAGAVLC